MRFTSIRIDKNNQKHIANRDVAWFLQKFSNDTSRGLIEDFRYSMAVFGEQESYSHFNELPRISASCELRLDDKGEIAMKQFNGIVVLEVRDVESADECSRLKRNAMRMPTSLLACMGADGRSVVVLVCVNSEQGRLPQDEYEATEFYAKAYYQLLPVYDGVFGRKVTRLEPFLLNLFLRPLDPTPLYNPNAVAFSISDDMPAMSDLDDHLLTQPGPPRTSNQIDMEAYSTYERIYYQAAQNVRGLLTDVEPDTPVWWQRYITAVAQEMSRMKVAEEETDTHLIHHLCNNSTLAQMGIDATFIRTVVASVYAEQQTVKGSTDKEDNMMIQLIRRMETHYQLRHNTIMGYTEFRPNNSWLMKWQPVTDKVINTFTSDLQIAGLKVWDRDVKRYINSTRVPDYSPIRDYLFNECSGKWDGRDRIRQLALTVPTAIPEQWAEWFHKWFLAMVAMWIGFDRRYGNSIMPLLISKQGLHKSTFCRNLLPPELRSWGYSDNLSLAEERNVHLAMAQMLLINLDEFNRISPQKQQGFLKNILQLPSVKVKRPYARHTEDVPRLASFIATTNMTDVLADPTGSRRFIGLQVTGSIDVSNKPNHQQLYAQALQELYNGECYWFGDDETDAIIRHNQQFQLYSSEVQAIIGIFEPVATDDPRGQWLTTTDMCQHVKRIIGTSIKLGSLRSIGRVLSNIPGMQHKRISSGNVYFVAFRDKPTSN